MKNYIDPKKTKRETESQKNGSRVGKEESKWKKRIKRVQSELRRWTLTAVTEGGRYAHACTRLCHRCHNLT